MNKKIKLSFLLILIIFLFSACTTKKTNTETPTIKPRAEKIEIINFYATYQCSACVYIGNMMFKIIEENFKEEYQDGKITFQKIDIDKPENKELANKFQARGSSLFFNFIADGQDNISEDAVVWRLVENDQGFKNYVIKKINDNLK